MPPPPPGALGGVAPFSVAPHPATLDGAHPVGILGAHEAHPVGCCPAPNPPWMTGHRGHLFLSNNIIGIGQPPIIVPHSTNTAYENGVGLLVFRLQSSFHHSEFIRRSFAGPANFGRKEWGFDHDRNT
ncbi:hypothetical protein PAPYR_11701 [Paratrimastix pyriformis]|uniref:Uncharacterized protein n=1 Tax=Paratrimastix pyriformis TaxID=342808 RepID=A0ABQ8U369_9EUKA|nr:hypothetical protein PAPYR_11701 [Paratrimastix pyriformis]